MPPPETPSRSGPSAGGRSLSFAGLVSNNPTHGGITSKALSVVHVFITADTSKQRLAELLRHAVPSVLAGTDIVKHVSGNLAQTKGIIKLSIGEDPAIRGDLGTMKFQLQAAVKIDPQWEFSAFTRRVQGARLL